MKIESNSPTVSFWIASQQAVAIVHRLSRRKYKQPTDRLPCERLSIDENSLNEQQTAHCIYSHRFG